MVINSVLILFACVFLHGISNSHQEETPREHSYEKKVFLHPFDNIDERYASFEKAQAICAKYGATLASVHSLEEEKSLTSWLNEVLGSLSLAIRLGGRRDSADSPWTWDDGSLVNYIGDWSPEHPQPGSVCIVVNTESLKWSAYRNACSEPFLVVCQRREG